MADLGNQLENWMSQVEKVFKMDANQRGQITGKGAEIYAEVLKKNTPVSTEGYTSGRSVGHVNRAHSQKPRKTKHLRDSITYKPGFTSDKLHTGATSVGFEDKYQAMVAGFVNNGVSNMSAKQIKNLHFMDNTINETRNEILKAEAEKYKEVTGL